MKINMHSSFFPPLSLPLPQTQMDESVVFARSCLCVCVFSEKNAQKNLIQKCDTSVFHFALTAVITTTFSSPSLLSPPLISSFDMCTYKSRESAVRKGAGDGSGSYHSARVFTPASIMQKLVPLIGRCLCGQRMDATLPHPFELHLCCCCCFSS